MRITRGILIPNYQSSYAIESKVDGIKDWQMSCTTMDKHCPCEVVIAGESAVIMFDKDIQPGSYDMDLEYMNTVISDIKEARELDIMEIPSMESIHIIDEKATEQDKTDFTNIASKYLDKFAMEELSLIGLDTLSMESGEVDLPSPQPPVEIEEETTVEESEPVVEEVPEPVKEEEIVDEEEPKDVQPVIPSMNEDESAQLKEFFDGLKEMGMTVGDFLSVIKSIKAFMLTQAKVITPEPEAEEVVAQEDYSYQDAVPYPERPGSEAQSTTGGVSDIADTEDQQIKAGETVASESVDPYAGLDNTVEPETVAMESSESVDEPESIEPESTPNEPEEMTDPEELFNEPETIATESDEEPFIMTLVKEVDNDADLFNLMMEHKEELPKEILMESININMYEKLVNNVIMNTSAIDKIKRGMRINN